MGQIGEYSIDLEVSAVPGEACYEATHRVLPRRARIMIARDPDAKVRVLREACILEALRHPGIPRVFDCGMIADRPWVATELVHGVQLGPQLTAIELAAILRDVATILAHAHRRGIIHNAVWLDAIVRDDGTRGFPVCLSNWSRATIGEPHEGTVDVRALGLAAYAAMPDHAPNRLTALVDDMLAPEDVDRPTAEEVVVIAASIVAAADDEIEAEEVRLVTDLSRELPAPPKQSTPVRRGTGWTPPEAYEPSHTITPSDGVPKVAHHPKSR